MRGVLGDFILVIAVLIIASLYVVFAGELPDRIPSDPLAPRLVATRGDA